MTSMSLYLIRTHWAPSRTISSFKRKKYYHILVPWTVKIKSNQIYISPADTMSYLGLMQHAIIYCTNKILINYGEL